MTASTLLFHGAVVFFIGMLLGFPLARKIAEASAHKMGHEPWRMAHSAICAAGAAMIAISGAYHLTHLEPWLSQVFLGSIIASAYSFSAGVVVAGITGYRGFKPEGPTLNWFVLSCNLVGVLGSLIAGVLLIWGTA